MGVIRIRWAAFTLAYYAANAVWQGYMSLYYRGIGFNDIRIGFISAAMSLCAMAAQPLWGMLGDQSEKKRRLLCFLALAAAAVLPMALISRRFILQILFACGFYIFYCALLPMGDAVLLDALNRENKSFGVYRLTGALGFALSGLIFGRIMDRTGAAAAIPVCAFLLAMAGASAWLLPEGMKKQKRKTAFAELFRNRELMALLVFMVPVQTTMGYFYTFYAPHFSAMPGGNSARLGLGYALATLSEIPYLVFCDKIYRKFGAAKPMCISALVLMLRWLLLGLGRHGNIAMASQLLHGGGFIVMTVSMAKYISGHVDENLRASGQMLLAMASFGVARVIGNLGGGFLADRMGSGRVFLICAGICGAAFCIFFRHAVKTRA